MADADGTIIPLTEDDQGEGIKDFLDDDIFSEFAEAAQESEDEMIKRMRQQLAEMEEKSG